MREKNYKEGWEYFEYRLHGLKSLFPDFLPLWDREPIQDKTILVYGERGFGDVIMFSRFLPILKEKCLKILFLPHPELSNIFEEKSLGIKVIKNIREEIFNVHTSIMSLPYKLSLFEEKDIPKSSKSYFKINEEKYNHYKDNYFINKKIKIGINWKGCQKPDTLRSIPLENFEKLFKLENISFYSLQTDINEKELDILKRYNIPNLGSTFRDFSDTVAAIENLDLVISNDTSVANLAASLEKNCLILLPYEQDWRWSNDLNPCIWYDTARLIKQPQENDWESVINIVLQELNNY